MVKPALDTRFSVEELDRRGDGTNGSARGFELTNTEEDRPKEFRNCPDPPVPDPPPDFKMGANDKGFGSLLMGLKVRTF